MKALHRYSPDVAFAILSEDTTHILVSLEVNDQTKGFAQGFQDLLDSITATAKTDETLNLAVARAEGFVYALDADLDVLVTSILTAVLASVAGNKEHAVYLFFVGHQTPGEIREPVLAEELDTVKTWVGPLQASPNPVLKTHGDTLAVKVAEADKRVADLATAEQALKAFREIGGRKQLIDSANALRAYTYGALNQLIDGQPEANLPADLADRVFRFERIRRQRKAITSKSVTKLITTNEKEHAALVELLATTQADEASETARKKKAKSKPDENALAAAKKKASDLAAEIAALEAKLAPPPAP